MPKTRRTRSPMSAATIRGFWRVNIVEHEEDGTPRIVGDSEWVHNRITILGLQNLATLLIGSAGSSVISRGALGTGSIPATNATTLPGEFGDATGASTTANRPPATLSTAISGVSTVNISFLFTWLSAQSFTNATRALSNIALYPNTMSGGTMFAGATFTSSALSTNQDVKAEDAYVVLALAA